MTFEVRLEQGRIGETIISKWLQSKGWTILPAYEQEFASGKGPRIFSAERDYIAPDILAFTNKKIWWVEAKHKEAFTWHRITREFVTGIDIRHYLDYLALQQHGPWPIYLLFLHKGGTAKDSPVSPSGLYGQSLAYLATHEHHRHENWGNSGMVYWSLGTLKKIADLNEKIPN